MSGTFTPTQLADQKVGDKSPPPSQNLIAQVADAAGDEISVTYTMQTGETRYAPMQTQPGTTITAKSASRPYPSSSYSVFKSGQWPQPNVQTTITAAWTYTRTSLVNTVSSSGALTEQKSILTEPTGQRGTTADRFAEVFESVEGLEEPRRQREDDGDAAWIVAPVTFPMVFMFHVRLLCIVGMRWIIPPVRSASTWEAE